MKSGIILATFFALVATISLGFGIYTHFLSITQNSIELATISGVLTTMSLFYFIDLVACMITISLSKLDNKE